VKSNIIAHCLTVNREFLSDHLLTLNSSITLGKAQIVKVQVADLSGGPGLLFVPHVLDPIKHELIEILRKRNELVENLTSSNMDP